jgi:hypothetical protein
MVKMRNYNSVMALQWQGMRPLLWLRGGCGEEGDSLEVGIDEGIAVDDFT